MCLGMDNLQVGEEGEITIQISWVSVRPVFGQCQCSVKVAYNELFVKMISNISNLSILAFTSN